MKRIAILTVVLLGASVSFAQEEQEIRALFDHYLTLFADSQSARIVEEIYAAPAFFTDQSLLTTAEIELLFDELLKDIKGRGWTHSIPLNIDVCELGDGSALLMQNYSRVRGDGELIPPRVRGSIYVLREFDVGWRIVAAYNRDPDIVASCT